MTEVPRVLCIGSVLWDIIGRSAGHMREGSDMPGRIRRQPGGVALNIGVALGRAGLHPVMLSAVGRDPEGDALISACAALGVATGYVYRSEDLPTDCYMAVEAANGLIAAIADAHSLEAAGEKILAPLADGRLGSHEQPYGGAVALDGNLTRAQLETLAGSDLLARADLRVAPASPGKVERLQPFVSRRDAVLYVNIEEAGLLCQRRFRNAPDAAEGLLGRGAARVIVTDGGNPACDGGQTGLVTGTPPDVLVTRVTGAGDTLMAAHIAAEMRGATREEALAHALETAAQFVSGDVAS